MDETEPKRGPGRPRKGEEINPPKDPEALLSDGITSNLKMLQSLRLKIERQLKALEETLDKSDEIGENGLERRQGAIKTISDTYKTLSDATANAVKALSALSKIEGKGSDPGEKDAEILEKLFGDNNETETQQETN